MMVVVTITGFRFKVNGFCMKKAIMGSELEE